jgi:hypothetical protein
MCKLLNASQTKFVRLTMQVAQVILVLVVAAGCNADCDSDVQEYINGVATLKLWAMQSRWLFSYSKSGGNTNFS